MAKFQTEVEKSVTVKVPIEKVYKYLWDVVGSSKCIPGLATCKKISPNTYKFTYEERSTGPVSMTVQYTAAYEGDGKSSIVFTGTGAKGDNTDVDGELRLSKSGDGTKIALRQKLAPDTPVPMLLQGLIRSFVNKEAADAASTYLANLKQTLESGKKA